MALTQDLVSSTIIARAREPEGLRTMMIASSAAHVAAIAALVIAPWLFGTNQRPEMMMEVSFQAGAPGVVSGGMTALSGRAVQKVEPKPDLPRPEPPRPPADKTPEMVEATPRPTPPKPVQRQASTSTRTAPPTTGEQLRPGQTRVDTGSTSTEGGLSTGGMGGNSAQSTVNFCDPNYLGQMVSLIHANWRRDQGAAGKPIVRFVIQRDGTLTDVTLKQSSGYAGLDLNATRAIQLTRAIPPLPACYPHADYAMNLTFEYIR